MAVGNGSLTLFDYLVYTTQDDDGATSTSPSSGSPSQPTSTSTPNHAPQSSASDVPDIPASPPHTPVGAVIGTVLGGIALLLGAVVGVFCFRRRRKCRRATLVEVGAANGGRKGSYDGRGERSSEYSDREGDGAFLAQPMLPQMTTISPLRSLGSEATYNPLSSLADTYIIPSPRQRSPGITSNGE